MRFKLINILFLILSATFTLNAQTKKEIEELYKDANSYYYFEDYEEALALFLRVYSKNPDNYNLCFKIGVCYLNIPGYKQQAIPYLEKAATQIKRHYNEQTIFETKAPYDALFYLGNAYFTNNQLDKAQRAYNKFGELIKDEKNWNLAYYNHQLNTLKSSRVLQSYPVNFIRNNLGEQFNNRFANYNAVVSGDQSTLAFTTKQRFYQAIMVSKKLGDKWSNPVNITLDLQVDGNCSTLSLSNDGNELYLYKDDSQDGNIYVTHFLDGRWAPMKKLNETINTKYYETHACISSDGKKLYFTSNRKGGFGDQDIYVSERISGDVWGPAFNLGPVINTSMNENTPFISADGNTLFFSSEGHNNLGGYDIFYSQKKEDNTWSEPINLGYPINTTDDDLFYFPLGDGSQGLIALFDKDGFGEQDLYNVDIFIPKYKRVIVTANDLLKVQTDDKLKTIVIDTVNRSGIALIDVAKSEIPSLLDTKKVYKIFFNGREYELRDQAEKTKTIITQLQQPTKEEKISIPITTEKLITDSNITEEKDFSTVQKRVVQLKDASDSSHTSKVQINLEVGNEIKSSQLSNSDKVTIAETNYLPEILSILSSNHSNGKMVNVFQKDLLFPSSLLKLKINQLIQAVDSAGNTEEYLNTFTRFIDLLCSSEFVTLKNQSRTISSNNRNQAFTYLFNQLLDKASPELKEFLEKTYQKYPTVNSFSNLWRLMRNGNPMLFEKLKPEIVKLLAEISIETYRGLPEDQKFKLYEEITNNNESKNNIWFIMIVLGYILIGSAGYIYLKKKHE